jgi:hypothetical protein
VGSTIMGMANSDDEGAIAERDALLRWADEAPENPGSYDHAPSEEASIAHDHAVREWKKRKPRTRPKYDR